MSRPPCRLRSKLFIKETVSVWGQSSVFTAVTTGSSSVAFVRRYRFVCLRWTGRTRSLKPLCGLAKRLHWRARDHNPPTHRFCSIRKKAIDLLLRVMVGCSSVPCWVAYAGTPVAMQKYIVKCFFFCFCLRRPFCLILRIWIMLTYFYFFIF